MDEDTARGFEFVQSPANSDQTIHEHAATMAINLYENLSKLLGDGHSSVNIDAIIKETGKMFQEKTVNAEKEENNLQHLSFQCLCKYKTSMEEVMKDNCQTQKFISEENLVIAHNIARTEAFALFKKQSSSDLALADLEKDIDQNFKIYLDNNQTKEHLVILEASDAGLKLYLDTLNKVFKNSAQKFHLKEKLSDEHKKAKFGALMHFEKLSLFNEQKSSNSSEAKLKLEKVIEDSFQVYEIANIGNIKKSIMEAKLGATSKYTTSMKEMLRDNCTRYLSHENIQLLHETARKEAIEFFVNKSSLKGKASEEANEMMNELENDLKNEYEIYLDINSKKLEICLNQMKNKGLEKYITAMKNKYQEGMLNVHLESLHNEAKEEVAITLKQEFKVNESLSYAKEDITAQIEEESEKEFENYVGANQRKQNFLLLETKQQCITKYLLLMEKMKRETTNKFFSEENFEAFHQRAKEEAIQSFKRHIFNIRNEKENNKNSIELLQKELDEYSEQYIQHNTLKERCIVMNAKEKSLANYEVIMSELSKYKSQEFITSSSFEDIHTEAKNDALRLYELLSLYDQEPSLITNDMRSALINEMNEKLGDFVDCNMKKQRHLLSEAQEGSFFKYIFNMEKEINNKGQNFLQESQLNNSHENFKKAAMNLLLMWIRPVEQHLAENNDLLSKLNMKIESKWKEFQQENKKREEISLCKAKSEALVEYKSQMMEVHDAMVHQKQLALEIFHGKANASAMDVFNKWSYFDLHKTEMAKTAKDQLEMCIKLHFSDIQHINEMKLKIEHNKKMIDVHLEKAKEAFSNKKRITADEKVKEECEQEIQRLNNIQLTNKLKEKIDNYGKADEHQLWIWNSCPLLLSCGHPCKEDWDKPCSVTCDEICNRNLECSHLCLKQWSMPCEPCFGQCEWSCDHQTCTKICGESCVPCEEGCFSPCKKAHACGHRCGGVDGEQEEHNCLPCLRCGHSDASVKQNSDEECILCFYGLDTEPAIQLECGHIFHGDCCRRLLKSGYNGPRITFAFAQCPLCKKMVNHWSLDKELLAINNLLKDVQQKALMRLEFEGLKNDKDIVTPGAPYYKDPAAFAMARYAYYLCFKCKKPYFGGAAECEAGDNVDEFNPEELVCPGCTGIIVQNCPTHGTEYIGFKCRYCCSLARWYCGGTTHYCDPCHNDNGRLSRISTYPKCPVGPGGVQLQGMCPLKIEHAPTGQEFPLGCGICNNINEF